MTRAWFTPGQTHGADAPVKLTFQLDHPVGAGQSSERVGPASCEHRAKTAGMA
jgi:hypothetical protein